MFGKWLAAAAAALTVGASSSAAARAFTVDDLLTQETLGARMFDPTGRWLVFEQRDRYDTAGRFDRGGAMGASLSRLQVVDMARPRAARRLLRDHDDRGVNLIGFSPRGSHLAIARLRDDSWTLGIAELRTGAVRWMAITPEDAPGGRTLEWVSEREVLVIDRPDGVPPWYLRDGSASAQGLPPLWAASARGEAGRTVIGSGIFRDLRAHRPPNRLLRVDVATGRFDILAEGDFFDLELAADGRHVALLAYDGDRQPHLDGPAQGTAGTSTRTATVVVVDLQSRRSTQPLSGPDVLPSLLAWSTDSRSLLVFARPRGVIWSAGGLQRIDAATSRATAVGPDIEPWLSIRPETIRAGWMGDVPIAYARRRSAKAGAFEWLRLDGEPRALTGPLPSGSRDLFAADAQGLTFRVNDAVWRVDPEGHARKLPLQEVVQAPAANGVYAPRLEGALPTGVWVEAGPATARFRAWVSAGNGTASGPPIPTGRDALAVSSNGDLFLRQTDAQGVETFSVRIGRRPQIEVARLNAGLAETDAALPLPVRHVGPNGEGLLSWLYLPAGSSSASPAPLIVRPYSGASYPTPPRELFGEKGFMTDVRMLVGHGYAVLVPSLPLPSGGDPMAGLADRILLVVDAVTSDPKAAAAVDLQHIALWGHSYGGYTVMATIAQTSRFRAAVAIAGYSEMVSKWATLPAIHRVATDEDLRVNWSMGSVEQGQGGMQVPPWSDPERYRRNSPLMAADRIRTPLLLAHGDQDIIPLTQSEAMFASLYRQDKDAILLTYFGEGHGLRSPGNVRDFYAHAFQFLDAWLNVPNHAP